MINCVICNCMEFIQLPSGSLRAIIDLVLMYHVTVVNVLPVGYYSLQISHRGQTFRRVLGNLHVYHSTPINTIPCVFENKFPKVMTLS